VRQKILKILICDGTQGCGNITADEYPTAQRCDWTRHGKWVEPKYAGAMEKDWKSNYRPVKGDAGGNAPIMRRARVVEVRAARSK
jgi:hypothetical protein